MARPDTFQRWLTSYVRDVQLVRDVALYPAVTPQARGLLVSALEYQTRRADLAPDAVPAIGVLDDAMVLRVAASEAIDGELGEVPTELLAGLSPLAEEVDAVSELLGDLYRPLVRYVQRRANEPIRGKSPDALLDDAKERTALLRDLDALVKAYRPAVVSDQEASRRQLVSYLRPKLVNG